MCGVCVVCVGVYGGWVDTSIKDHLDGLLPSVPARPPQNISALVLNSTSVRLSWQPPSLEDQNGIIIMYTVNVSSITAMSFKSTDTELVVGNLNAFTQYNFTIAAETSVGSGPFSDPVQRMTLEGSEYLVCHRAKE